MKKLIAVAIIAIIGVSIIGTSALADDPIVATTIREDGSTNTWTQADLQSARPGNRRRSPQVARRTNWPVHPPDRRDQRRRA